MVASVTNGNGSSCVQARKLDPNSAAARRRKAAGAAAADTSQQQTATAADLDFTSFHEQFESNDQSAANPELAFSTTSNPFASVTSECDVSNAIQESPVFCGLNLSFLQDWILPTGESGENNGTANVGTDIFEAFDNDDNATPSAANAFANFDTPWGETEPEQGARSQSEGDFAAIFDPDAEKDRSPLRRAVSGKEKSDSKHRTRKPRRKSGNTGGDSSGGEGLNDSFSEMNVSNPENHGEQRKPRREPKEGDKRPAGTRSSGGERRRRPKEPGEEEKSTPRRNRSSRESSRTSG